jgi:uncharacterized protein YciI
VKRLFAFLCLATATYISAQAPQIPQGPNIPTNLKPYFLGLVVHGANWTPSDTPEGKLLMPAHLAFVREQIESHKFLFAGPLLDSGNIVGFAVIAASSAEEATTIASGDPEIKAGRLAIEVHPTLLPDLSKVQVEFPTSTTPPNSDR